MDHTIIKDKDGLPLEVGDLTVKARWFECPKEHWQSETTHYKHNSFSHEFPWIMLVDYDV